MGIKLKTSVCVLAAVMAVSPANAGFLKNATKKVTGSVSNLAKDLADKGAELAKDTAEHLLDAGVNIVKDTAKATARCAGNAGKDVLKNPTSAATPRATAATSAADIARCTGEAAVESTKEEVQNTTDKIGEKINVDIGDSGRHVDSIIEHYNKPREKKPATTKPATTKPATGSKCCLDGKHAVPKKDAGKTTVIRK